MITQLLVPLDQSTLAEAAIARAVALAHATGARLDVVLVHEPFTIGELDDAPVNSRRCADEEAYLDRIARELVSGTAIKPTWTLLTGRPVEMICRRAADVGADLIVMTSHGRTGFSRAWLGSVADGVIRRSRIPVLLLRSTDAEPTDRRERLFSHALVLIDASAESETIIDDALAVARAGKGHVTLLHIVQPVPLVIPEYGIPVTGPPMVVDTELTEHVADEARDRLGALGTLAGQAADVNTAVVIDGHVARAILDFAIHTKADLIALTTHGRGASRLIIGSIADKVLRGSNLPVLIKRPRDD